MTNETLRTLKAGHHISRLAWNLPGRDFARATGQAVMK